MGDFSDKWGLLGHYMLRWPLSTSVSEGGLGHEAGLTFSVNDDLENRYTFGLAYSTMDYEGAANDPEAAFLNHSHRAFTFAMGNQRRIFTTKDNHWFSVFGSINPYLGIGTTAMGSEERTVGGVNYPSDDNSAHTFDIGTQYGGGLELMPVPHFDIQIAPQLIYGVSFKESGSEWNRLMLEFAIMASIGYGDKSASPDASDAADPNASDLEIAYRTFAQIHGIIAGVLSNMALSEMQERISDWIPVGEGDPQYLEDVRALQGAAGFLGGLGQAASQNYFLRVGNLNPIPLALEAVGGIAIIAASGGSSGRGSGVSSLLNAFGMSVYMMMGVDTPSERQVLGDNAYPKLLGTALIRHGINDLAFIIGALAVNSDSQSDFGLTLLGGAGQANFAVAFSPDPSKSGAVDRTSYSYIPLTFYHGEDSGSRSGLLIQRSWHDWPVYTEAKFLTHFLYLGNLGKRFGAAPSEPYSDAALLSEIVATLGVHYETTWFRIGAGLDTLIQYGASESVAGIGAGAGLDLLVPFDGHENGTGLTLGVRGSIAKLFPGGYQYEFAPHLGLTGHF